MRERCEGEMGFERREFIRSIRWGVCDSLNCRHSRENISIKVFYNRASLGLTFLASRREGVWSEEVWSRGVGGSVDEVEGSRGGVGRGEKKGIIRIQTVSLKSCVAEPLQFFFPSDWKKRSSRETEPVFQRSSTWLAPIREAATCRLKPPLNLCPPPALRVLQRIVHSLCMKCTSSFWAEIFLPLQLFFLQLSSPHCRGRSALSLNFFHRSRSWRCRAGPRTATWSSWGRWRSASASCPGSAPWSSRPTRDWSRTVTRGRHWKHAYRGWKPLLHKPHLECITYS